MFLPRPSYYAGTNETPQSPAKKELRLWIFSRDRILTTHVGSLPRNEKLSDLLMAQEEGKDYDPKVMVSEMDKAVRHVVTKQMEAGIDIGNDGEQRRISFQTYVPQRMTGFGGVSKRRRGREFKEFPELLAYLMRRFPNPAKSQQGAPEAQADIKYKDLKPITEETAGFNKIADQLGAFSERFMTAPSPGIISTTMLNAYYKTHDDYLDAIAREMKNEYQTIHKAGLILRDGDPARRRGRHRRADRQARLGADVPRQPGARLGAEHHPLPAPHRLSDLVRGLELHPHPDPAGMDRASRLHADRAGRRRRAVRLRARAATEMAAE